MLHACILTCTHEFIGYLFINLFVHLFIHHILYCKCTFIHQFTNPSSHLFISFYSPFLSFFHSFIYSPIGSSIHKFIISLFQLSILPSILQLTHLILYIYSFIYLSAHQSIHLSSKPNIFY